MTDRKRVFSGIQPTGRVPHVGNYVGALHNWVKMQDDYETIYCVVDLHSLTVPYEPRAFAESRIATAKMLLAVGVDPERSLLYFQADVAQHVELSWILGTITGLGQLERMTQFKEKAGASGQKLGLLAYPVLMAADILVHKAHAVPVGDDQAQHLELTRDIAARFNSRFGEEFPIPERITPEIGARIMSLTDPTSKMSGSDASAKSRIHLDDPSDAIIKKVKAAMTDTGAEVAYDPVSKPGVSNLLELFSFFSGRSVADIVGEYATGGYGSFKVAVGEVVAESLRPIRERYQAMDSGEVVEVMKQGAKVARERAEAEMESVRRKVGLG